MSLFYNSIKPRSAARPLSLAMSRSSSFPTEWFHEDSSMPTFLDFSAFKNASATVVLLVSHKEEEEALAFPINVAILSSAPTISGCRVHAFGRVFPSALYTARSFSLASYLVCHSASAFAPSLVIFCCLTALLASSLRFSSFLICCFFSSNSREPLKLSAALHLGYYCERTV